MTTQDKRNLAYQIVDFWHVIEFLTQEPYPKNTKETEKNVTFVNKMLTSEAVVKSKWDIPKRFELFYPFPINAEIPEILQLDNENYTSHQVCGSSIHICMGKVKRELFIRCLYTCLGLEDDRPEQDNSDLCLIGLKVDQDGIYVPGSLQISPVMWGVAKCAASGGRIDGVITKSNYNDDVGMLEKKLSEVNPLLQSDILQFHNAVWNQFILPACGENAPRSPDGLLIYKRYDCANTFDKEDDKSEDYSNLQKGFYADDLDMVKAHIAEEASGGPMCQGLLDYIVGAYRSHYHGGEPYSSNRIDIRNSKDDIRNWLLADKSPLGKWPSRFNPALMQQIAINIGIQKSAGAQTVLSVNGPPGTGKTTLLKEIIATNIVERAQFLCRYERADDAFVPRSYMDGNFLQGTSRGYDRFYGKFHAFKDDALNEFTMLVASCNNAAVENITRELPDGVKIIDGLKPLPEDDAPTVAGVETSSSLFDISRTERTEQYKVFVKDENGKYKPGFVARKDIYFSWLAQNLIEPLEENTENLQQTQWGLISAPMGKASNIGRYYRSVLGPLFDSFYKNELIKNRHEGYVQARQAFQEQIAVVGRLQKELADISHLQEKYRERAQNYSQSVQDALKRLRQYDTERKAHLQHAENLRLHHEEIAKVCKEDQRIHASRLEEYQTLEVEFLQAKETIGQISAALVEKEDARKLREVLLGKWLQTERLRQITELRDDMVRAQQKEAAVGQALETGRQELEAAAEKLTVDQRQLAEITAQIDISNQGANHAAGQISQENHRIQDAKEAILKERGELQALLRAESGRMVVMDDRFWANFDNEDEQTATLIQTSNPWITHEYNRAREKLFYLALQLHKEFILSSKACRDNLMNLAFLWKCRENSESSVCQFTQRDKENAYPHLLSTLFLLTPVLSTTFAAAGRFLRNIKENQLGLLIVDEAGQAPPHAAVGALWRCRRAIIVGDPKQVEPVVTDDADTIKRAFTNDVIRPYLRKTISVQECADQINPYGSTIADPFQENGDLWVGCPLVVHRRCIDPMFTISNTVSYGGTMKQQTTGPKPADEARFAKSKSCWIQVSGKEIGRKNHYVREQGEAALELVVQSFESYGGYPDLYVISPFTTVINGINGLVNRSGALKQYGDAVSDWLDKCCGTVHKFQGKEAKEVIFLLGCDSTASGAVQWVKPNILNVAATRAKFRLYVIGDYGVWKRSRIFETAKMILN